MEKESKEQIIRAIRKGWSIFPLSLTAVEEGEKVKKIVHFPIKDGKEGWKQYQTEKITEDRVDWEWLQFDQCGVATGKLSNLTCIDLDTKDMTRIPLELFNTYVVESPRGFHLYFKYNPEVKQTQCTVPNIDLRSEGGFLFCSPTKYTLPNGEIAEYKVVNDVEPAKFPIEWYRKTFGQDKSNWKQTFTEPILPGSRNIDFTSIIGGLLKRFPMDEWESVVWPTVQDKNKLQEKPLSVSELKTTYDSICKAETQVRHQGGDIKDISVEVIEDDMRVNIRLEQCVICFKIKNIISSLAEAGTIAWIEKPAGLTSEIPFYLKVHSDTNKEQWVRILSKAFDRKDNKEIYPWTIIVAKVVSAIENHIKNRQQCFAADTIEAKECTWLLEPFIQEDMINTIFGMGSSGKTLLALYFSKEIAQLLGHNILFVDYEDTPGGWKSKLAKINGLNDFTVDLNKFFYFDSEQIPIAEQVDKIKDEIKKHDIKLVVVDSASLATGESTSDEKSAVRLVSALKLLKTTVLLIAHQRKNDGDRTPIGSIQYENQSRNVWNIKGVPDDNDNRIIHIACTHTKTNNTWLRRNPLGLVVEYADDYIRISEENAYEYFQEKYSVIQNIEKLLKDEGELGYKEIATSIGITPASANKNLTTGKKRKLFENKDGKWSVKKPP